MARSPRGVEARKQFDAQSRVLRFQSLSGAAADGAGSDRRRDLSVGDRSGQVGDRQDVPRRHERILSRRRLRSRHHRLEHQGARRSGLDRASASIPFPTHMEGRTCRMEKVVVSSAAGQVVKFHTHSGLGGIADTLGKVEGRSRKESGGRPDHHHARRGPRRRQRAVVHSLSEPRYRRRRARGAARRAVRQVSIRRDGHRTQRRGTEANRPAEVS